MKAYFKDPLVWLVALFFILPFIVQMSFFPIQKLSMYSEDPSAYRHLTFPVKRNR